MRIALWQDGSPMGDRSTALARIDQATRAAGAAGAAIVVLPEAYLPGYNHPVLRDLAVPRTDPVFDQIGGFCRASGCGLVLGYAERDGDTLFNAAIAFDADGEIVANYRKIQLFGPREKELYKPGNHYTILEFHGQKAALLICYDIEFAHHISALAAQGVTLVFVPTANMDPFDHVVRHTVPTMAANYGVSIVYANYCGAEGNLSYVGGSLITGPHGEILAQAGRGPAFLVADIPKPDAARLSTQGRDLVLV